MKHKLLIRTMLRKVVRQGLPFLAMMPCYCAGQQPSSKTDRNISREAVSVRWQHDNPATLTLDGERHHLGPQSVTEFRTRIGIPIDVTIKIAGMKKLKQKKALVIEESGGQIVINMVDNLLTTLTYQTPEQWQSLEQEIARLNQNKQRLILDRFMNMNHMVPLEGSTFTMSCRVGSADDCADGEWSPQQVSVNHFMLGKHEVTQEEWEAVMGYNPSRQQNCPACPVDAVDWDEVQSFLRNLKGLTGIDYRLPTEAEWEYAARGGKYQYAFNYSGSNLPDLVGWYEYNSKNRTWPVGSKYPNAMGLYDMTGNVMEWCSDSIYSNEIKLVFNEMMLDSLQFDFVPVSTVLHVTRGGSYRSHSFDCQLPFRFLHKGVNGIEDAGNIGFRLAISAKTGFTADTAGRALILQNLKNNMLQISGGEFQMGCNNENDNNCFSGDNPLHTISVGNFKIGKFEVTQEEWTAVMGSNQSFFKNCAECPVENVSWADIQVFLHQLNSITGGQYRLPTEAEWEYAARAADSADNSYYATSARQEPDEFAWFSSNADSATHPVGQKRPNNFGLYDMSGNVWEWCSDWYLQDFYGNEHNTINPQGPNFGIGRVLRGHAWDAADLNCWSTDRAFSTPESHSLTIGFRLVAPATMVDTVAFIQRLQNNMVFVQGGTFSRGFNAAEFAPDCLFYGVEPFHNVTLNDFKMGKYEVTQEEWEAVMGYNPSTFDGCDSCPVEFVSWNEIQLFLQKLNTLTGGNYRLPTEAEWEYAARGGIYKSQTKYSGSSNIEDVAWYGENSGHGTHLVGQKQANALGLYDMSGSVWEWCNDWFRPYSADATHNPKGPINGFGRVLRGGSRLFNSCYSLVSLRHWDAPDRRYPSYGFRLVSPGS